MSTEEDSSNENKNSLGRFSLFHVELLHLFVNLCAENDDATQTTENPDEVSHSDSEKISALKLQFLERIPFHVISGLCQRQCRRIIRFGIAVVNILGRKNYYNQLSLSYILFVAREYVGQPFSHSIL